MAGSAHGFKKGYLALYQTLFKKLDKNGNARTSLTRSAWYK
jgi:hypothetical protein